MANLNDNSIFLHYSGDVNGDGKFDRKDSQRCTFAELKAAIEHTVDTDTISVEQLSINGNIITVNPGDGSSSYQLTIEHPPQVNLESDGIVVSGAGQWDFMNGTITYPTVNDFDQSPAVSIVDNTTIPALVSLLTSTPHPELQGSGSITVSFNAASNSWTVHSEDEDTRCEFITLPNGQVQKTATTYVNGVATDSVVTVFGLPRLSASELCALVVAELETNPSKSVQVSKILQNASGPIGPVCVGQVQGTENGKLYFNADGTNKLEFYDAPTACLKPYPVYECMCIELDDGRLMTLNSVSPQQWVEKEGVDYLEIACGLVDDPDALQKLSNAIDTTVTYEFGQLTDSDPNDGMKKLVLQGSNGQNTCVMIPDSTELPDVDTTYSLQVVANVVTLIGSDGSTSGGPVVIQTFDETLIENPDGSYTFVDNDGSSIVIPRPRTARELCDAVFSAISNDPVKLNQWRALIDSDTVVTYSFDSLVDDDPNDGMKKLVLTASDGSSTCVLIPDSSELPDIDTDTTYSLQVIDGTVTLIASDGTTSGGDIFIETFDETFSSNPDGSHTFTDDDGSTVTIPRPRTADEICQAVLASLSINSTKLNAYKALINEPDVRVSDLTIVDGVVTVTLTDGTVFTDNTNGPVQNTYGPDANGDVLIPLTDGGSITLSGLVSPEDIDFSSTTVTVDTNNDYVISYLDSNGDQIAQSVIPGDDVEGSLGLASDGCTLVGTLDDGTAVSVPFCDYVSSLEVVINPDGSQNVTHTGADGTFMSFTIPAPVVNLVKQTNNGVVRPKTDADVVTLVNPNELIRLAVSDGSICGFNCDNNEIITIQSNMRRTIGVGGGTKVVSADSDPAGTVVKIIEFDLLVQGKCTQQVVFESTMAVESFGSETGDGSWNFQSRISTNGGSTSSGMISNGSDSFRTQGLQGENMYRWYTRVNLAPGTYPIRIEYSVQSIAGNPAPVQIAVASAFADINYFSVC